MSWFAAHEIEYFKVIKGKQDFFRVWENVYLIEAENSDEAWEKAERLSKEHQVDYKTSGINGQPAKSVVAGIRKIVEVSHWEEKGVLRHADEITYNEFNVSDERDVQKMMNGEPVKVEFLNLYSEK